MSRPSDYKQREAARDPSCSWIVQAPAGSGKTELLTQRMLALLARAEQPEEVVAITFTRKAAAEMSHRLVEQLRLAQENIDTSQLEEYQRTSNALARAVLDNSQQRGWNLLEHSSRLRIRTIDSLCSDLARQLPILSGLGGGQQIAEDVDALYRTAATRTMALIEDDEDPSQADVIRLLDRYDNQYDRLVELLTAMLGQREQWIPYLLRHRQGEGFDREALEDSLRYLVDAQIEQAGELMPAELADALPALLQFISEQPGDHAHPTFQLPVESNTLAQWKSVAALLLTQGGDWRSRYTKAEGFPAATAASNPVEKALFQEMKADMLACIAALREQESFRQQLAVVALLPTPEYTDEAWQSLQAMMRLLQRAALEWQLLIAQSGEADFSEISARAIEALGEEGDPSPLALRLDYRINHLLVDEFQDTSHSQIRLIERLTTGWEQNDGRTLFLVGDPMQSIYRFRKAEVSLFMQAFNGELFPHMQLKPLRLSVNFRSMQPVVEWVNRVFPSVMPTHEDPVMGAVVYSAAETRPDVSGDGCVITHFTANNDGEKEARTMVQLIEAADPDHTIAILVRSRAHARDLVRELDALREGDSRFRYQAVELTPLSETQHIRDLVSLTLALLQGADRLAWLSVLRTPWVGLTLSDLDLLFSEDWNQLIGEIICSAPAQAEPWPGLSSDGRQRLQRAGPVLAHARESIGRHGIRDLVEACWVRLGGPACAGNESEIEDAQTYFKLLESLENEGIPIDRDSITASLDKLYAEADAQADGRLQIMTIHKAKGLQFDTVILPALNRGSGKPEHRLLHWFEIANEDRIVFSPMRNAEEKETHRKEGDLIRFISSVDSRREAFESGRLLYVAATRARRELHLMVSANVNANDDLTPRANTPLAQLWPSLKAEVDVLWEAEPATGEAETAPALPEIPQVFRRLPADWQLPAAPPSISSSAWEEPAPSELIPFEWAQQDARLTGNLVHRLLQEVSTLGITAWQSSGDITSRQSWCLDELRSQGVDAPRGQAITDRVSRAIGRCLNSERGRWLLAEHSFAHSEYAVTAVLNGIPKNMILDRTFVDDGERWIIDYKTSSHGGGDLQGFLDNEEVRYRDQLLQYREAIALTETRPIRCALYFPLLDAFREI